MFKALKRSSVTNMNRKKSRDVERISPEDALQFLEDIRILSSDIDQSSIAISLRVPENILNIIKVKAKADGKKYLRIIRQPLARLVEGLQRAGIVP